MKEEFLHYVWRYQLFASKKMRTTTNESLQVVKAGILNTNAGPDFLNATINIDAQLWSGTVEIHVKSSDWYVHNHEKDPQYDAVILHVVWEEDVSVFMKNNKPLPTLVLKELVLPEVFKNYKELSVQGIRWIPCENQLQHVAGFVIANWLERLYIERLERKTAFIERVLVENNNDYEAVFFQLLTKNFGLKVNGDAFFNMARSFGFPILRKRRSMLFQLEALLFGQARMLTKSVEDPYYQSLQKEYSYLQQLHTLSPVIGEQFHFFRMRPSNFPTVRIAQLAALYHAHDHVFSKAMEITKMSDFYTLFSVQVSDFWATHYTFEKRSNKQLKKLTKSFVDLLVINTVIPLKYSYQKSKGVLVVSEILSLMQQIAPEKNSQVSQFQNLGLVIKNAYESQALLTLKSDYCEAKKCLNCGIGNALLRSKV